MYKINFLLGPDWRLETVISPVISVKHLPISREEKYQTDYFTITVIVIVIYVTSVENDPLLYER
jgi:hypothetical protein